VTWPALVLSLLLAAAAILPGLPGAAPGRWAREGAQAMGQAPETAVAGAQARPLPPQAEDASADRRDASTGPAETRPPEDDAVSVAQAAKPWRAEERPPDADETVPARKDAEPSRDGAQALGRPWRGEKPGPAAGQDAGGNGTQVKGGPIRLFGTTAFRGNFNALPKWKRVLSKAKGQVQALNSCSGAKCPPGAASWQRIMSQTRGMEPMEQLKAVNAFFNKWPYRLDQDAYGTSDWWATPQEFLKISGDCEDFSITKYFALRELGFAADDLRIVILKDRIRGIAHAVLAVFLQGDAYVLDNVSGAIFPHTRLKHYIPYYSVNENHRWSHIPVDKQP
jgi:predicted transglutaminase-like cysteine proteinase